MYISRESVIIEYPLKWQFYDLVTVILTSRTALSGVVENVDKLENDDDNDDQTSSKYNNEISNNVSWLIITPYLDTYHLL